MTIRKKKKCSIIWHRELVLFTMIFKSEFTIISLSTYVNPCSLLCCQEATGAVLVSREPNKLIIYRGWPAGERRPDMFPEDEKEEEVPPELRAAIVREEIRNPMDFSYLTREECALVGIEYAGNRAESEQEDDFNKNFDGRQHSEDDDDNYYGVTEAVWNDEKWYAEHEDEEDENEDEDDAEAEIWNMKLEDIESD